MSEGASVPTGCRTSRFVVFDPATTPPHWELLLMAPLEAGLERDDQQQQAEEEEDGARQLVDWPPLTWTCHLFSSQTMAWEERVFVRVGETVLLERRTSRELMREGEAPGAYCHGALYMLHCRGAYVTR
ncbi:hypothetical protein U9M48_001308 [Paspalum notatum var. saurae]|uniref:Uncharacterized protein n=1 Tax=Paspalum notatum var. saurae TaxID=547442 RepID=A0AAQ3PFS1_PASNO